MGASERDTHEAVDAPGVSDTEIRFRSISTITGNPLGTDIGNAYNEGIEAYFAWRNSEGGIYGRDLVLESGRRPAGQQRGPRRGAGGRRRRVRGLRGDAAVHRGAGARRGRRADVRMGHPRRVLGQAQPVRPQRADLRPVHPARAGRTWPRRRAPSGSACSPTTRPTRPRRAARACGRRSSSSAPRPATRRSCSTTTTCRSACPAASAPQVAGMKATGVEFVDDVPRHERHEGAGRRARQAGHGRRGACCTPTRYDADFVAANAGDASRATTCCTTFTPFETEIDSDLQDRFFEWTERQGVDRPRADDGRLDQRRPGLHRRCSPPARSSTGRPSSTRPARSPDYNAGDMIETDRLEPPGGRPRHRSRRRRPGVRRRRQVQGRRVRPAHGRGPDAPWLCWASDERGVRRARRWGLRVERPPHRESRVAAETVTAAVSGVRRVRRGAGPGGAGRRRVHAGRHRLRAHVQDVGRLQPGVRRPGVRVGRRLLRAARPARAGRSGRACWWRSASSPRCSAC